jgi:hypothetical protein
MDAPLDLVKNFIRETAPVDVIEERALLLAGEPQDKVEDGLAVFCEELGRCFSQQELSATFVAGFTIAAADMVRERIDELNSNGTGRA